jgi:hypothetical protein
MTRKFYNEIYETYLYTYRKMNWSRFTHQLSLVYRDYTINGKYAFMLQEPTVRRNVAKRSVLRAYEMYVNGTECKEDAHNPERNLAVTMIIKAWYKRLEVLGK